MPLDGFPSRSSVRFVLRFYLIVVALVSCCLTLAQTPESGEEERIAAGEAEVEPIPLAISLGNVPMESIALEENLKGIEAKLAPPSFLEELDSILGETNSELRELDQDIARLSGQLVGKDGVTEQISKVTALLSRLNDYQDQLAEHAAGLQESRLELADLREVWTLTQAEAIEQGAPDTLLADISGQLENIESLERLTAANLDENLSAQEELSSSLRLLSKRNEQLTDIYVNMRTELFDRDSKPIWRIFGSEEDGYVVSNFQDHMGVGTASIKRFYHSNPKEFKTLAVWFVIVVAVLLYARFGLAENHRSDPRMEAIRGFALACLSSAFLVIFFIRPFLLPTTPTAWRLLFNLVALVSMYRLLPLLVGPHWRKILHWTLLIPFLLFLVQLMVSEESLVGRFTVLVAAVLLSVIFRRVWKSSKETEAGSLVRLGSYIGMVFSVVSVLANLLGYGALSTLLVQALIRSGMLLLFVIFGYRFLMAVFRMLLIVSPLNRMNSIKSDLHLFERHFSTFLKWVLTLFWLMQVLALFSIFDIVYGAIVSFFSLTISLGSLNISVGAVSLFILTVWVSVLLSRGLRYFLSSDVLPRMRLDRGAPEIILMMLHYSVISLGFILALGVMGVELQQISILIGALGVGIGLGLQDLVNNFVSGLILAFERPIKNGDKIEFGGTFGEVKHIGIRASVVRAFDGADTIVPNGHLVSNEVINWTFRDQQRRIEVKVGVAYGTSPDDVIALLMKVAADNEEILKDPLPLASFDGFGDSSLNFTLRCWTSEFGEFIRLSSEMNVAVYRALEEAGINIPFPQRDVHLRMIRPEK